MLKSVCFLVLIAISFSSCQKLLDYYNYKDNDEPSSGCRIKTITTASGAQVNTARIQYSSNGLPAAVEYEMHDVPFDYTETYTFHYVYDHLGRLVSETSDWVYGDNLVFYAYEGDSKLPVRDTIKALYVSYVEDLEYDTKGRIIKKTLRDFEFVIPEDNPGPHPDEVYQYYYDLRGNRQEHMSNPDYPGIIQYSDKPSLYSLHPVWQLIHKNYSKNSVPFGETFNNRDLPLTIKKSGVPYFQPFLNLSPGSVIEYECEQ
jgi:hypothetical protein